jgi:hypothetical protein
MYFQEITEAGYRIYVGALESPVGDGYTAALVVQPDADADPAPAREGFRDDSLACGHRWATAEDAMGYALRKARQFIRSNRAPLAC